MTNHIPSHTDRFNKIWEDIEFQITQQPLVETPIKLISEGVLSDKADRLNNEPSYAEPLYMGAGRWFIPELKR